MSNHEITMERSHSLQSGEFSITYNSPPFHSGEFSIVYRSSNVWQFPDGENSGLLRRTDDSPLLHSGEFSIASPSPNVRRYSNLIYQYDKVFLDSDKYNGQYVIGLQSLSNEGELIPIFESGISAKTFYNFSYEQVLHYLYMNALNYNSNYKIEIIKIIIIGKERTYMAITKTFWLKIIQRKWRNIVKMRKNIMMKRGKIINQMCFQLYGKYPEKMRTLPSLCGMLM